MIRPCTIWSLPLGPISDNPLLSCPRGSRECAVGDCAQPNIGLPNSTLSTKQPHTASHMEQNCKLHPTEAEDPLKRQREWLNPVYSLVRIITCALWEEREGAERGQETPGVRNKHIPPNIINPILCLVYTGLPLAL